MDSHNNIDQSVSELLLDPASVQQLYNSQLRGPEFDQQRQIRNQVLPFNKMTDTIDNDNIPLSSDYDKLYQQLSIPSQQQYENNSDNVYKTNNDLAALASPLNMDLDLAPSDQQQQPQQSQQQFLNDFSNLQPHLNNSQEQVQLNGLTSNILSNPQITVNMPGAYHQNYNSDQMEIDDSPPFTIELDLYFEQQTDNNSIVTSNRVHNQPDVESMFNNQLSVPSLQRTELLPQQHETNVTTGRPQESAFGSFDNNSRVSSFANVNNAGTNLFVNGKDLYFDDESHHRTGRLRNGSIDSYYAANVINHQLHLQQQTQAQAQAHQQQQQQLQQQHSPQDLASHTSLPSKSIYNELSPLTTTTSRASSIQSGQPSFFSAQQYFSRNSMDQVPSSLHRPSFDLYNHRPSIDSQHSQQLQQRNARYTSFTSSISNILPFMSEKNTNHNSRSPPTPPTSTSSPQNLLSSNQSRHLIRSIFKTNPTPIVSDAGNSNGNIVNGGSGTIEAENLPDAPYASGTINDSEFLILSSPTKEEPEDELMQPKKVKKPKRSLFTRFKTPVKQEQPDLEMAVSAPVDELKPDETVIDMVGNISLHHSSGTPSITTGAGGNTLEHSISESSFQEPDYAALFENVGKRKNKSYRKPKGKTKEEEQQQQQLPLSSGTAGGTSSNNSTGTVEKTLFFNKTKIKKEPASERSSLLDNASAGNASASSSEASLIQNAIGSDDHNGPPLTSAPTSSTLANASKRILSSKLILKKKSTSKLKEYTAAELEDMCTVSSLETPVATMISKGIEVEVDLASLDLPPDTKIFPTSIINNKNRTRGRKENKEADLSDTSKIYLCNLCQRRFKRHEHLKRHFRSLHTFEKPYNCDICHKKFSRSDNLNQHLKIHKQEDEKDCADAETGVGMDDASG